jgi:glucose 1-dehydrogenase
MKAIAVFPGKPNSAHMVEMPRPSVNDFPDGRGVLALLGISGGNREITVPGAQINLELVLGNEMIFGSVNANRRYFEMGVGHFGIFEQKWPGAMQKLMTRRVAFEDFHSAFERHEEDIKVFLEMGALREP